MNLFKDWAFYRVFDEQTSLGVAIFLRRQFEYDFYFVVTIWKLFVACYATPPRYISLSVCSSVLPSIRPHFIYVFGLTALPQPKCSSNSNIAPAHPYVTGVAVYTALFGSMSVDGVHAAMELEAALAKFQSKKD